MARLKKKSVIDPEQWIDNACGIDVEDVFYLGESKTVNGEVETYSYAWQQWQSPTSSSEIGPTGDSLNPQKSTGMLSGPYGNATIRYDYIISMYSPDLSHLPFWQCSWLIIENNTGVLENGVAPGPHVMVISSIDAAASLATSPYGVALGATQGTLRDKVFIKPLGTWTTGTGAGGVRNPSTGLISKTNFPVSGLVAVSSGSDGALSDFSFDATGVSSYITGSHYLNGGSRITLPANHYPWQHIKWASSKYTPFVVRPGESLVCVACASLDQSESTDGTSLPSIESSGDVEITGGWKMNHVMMNYMYYEASLG